MNKQETVKLITYLMTAYPNYNPKDPDLTIEVWTDLLSEYTYEQVNMGLKAYMRTDTSGFAPAPGQLIGHIQPMKQSGYLNEMEAWALVSEAVRNSAYHATEEFDKLPPLVQRSVGTPQQLQNWAITDTETLESVIQSNFMRTYRAEVARDREYQKMPREVRATIDKANRDRPVLYEKPHYTETARLTEKPGEMVTGEQIDRMMSKIYQELGISKGGS